MEGNLQKFYKFTRQSFLIWFNSVYLDHTFTKSDA